MARAVDLEHEVLGRCRRRRQLDRDLACTGAVRAHGTGAGLDRRLAVRPAEVVGEARGAPRAVDAQARRLAVGVPVRHLGAVVAAAEDEEAIGADRDAPPAPGRDLLGARIGRRLDQRDEVVAAARDLVELHGALLVPQR
jgi:hypothetical protein